MLGIITPVATKPDRVATPERQKDQEYDRQYARWCIYDAYNSKWIEHQNRIALNKSFYSPNGQWVEREDLEAFFMDRSGQTNNRVRVEMNMIQIMGNQYVGNANRMVINARAKSYSPLCETRRIKKLQEVLAWTSIANNATPELQSRLRKDLPIGDNKEDTLKTFDNFYVDSYVRAVNALLRYSETVNSFESRKKPLSEDLVYSGMGIMKPYFYNGEYRFRQVWSDRFFWDKSAREYDLSDANYMGEWDYMMPTDIYESCPAMTPQQRSAIEAYVSSNSSGTFSVGGKIVVYTVYWRDCVKDEFGYVKDSEGNIYFERINYESDWGYKSQYTDADLVNVSELNKEQRKIIGKEKSAGTAKAKRVAYCDQWRYCKFIPSEIVGGYYQGYKADLTDMILESGVVSFQEPNIYTPDNMLPPYKVNQYLYIDGNTYSPIDIAINPQRMANRILSVVENMMNNSRGSGTAYDPEMVDDEAQFLSDMHQSKPVAIRTKGLGINNVISRYDNTVGNGAVVLKQFADSFIGMIENITGVTNAMKGQIDSPDQLVGVYQLMIRRGSITQERFYDAIERIFTACYQAIATSGRRYYSMNRKKLIDYIGDDNARVIELSNDLSNEDMKVTVKRSLSPDDERKFVDSTIMQLLQMKMLDQARVSNLLGRGTEDDMWMAVREFSKETEIMQREIAQQQKKQEAMGALDAIQQQRSAEENSVLQQMGQSVERQRDRQHDIDKMVIGKTLDNNNNPRQLPQERMPVE